MTESLDESFPTPTAAADGQRDPGPPVLIEATGDGVVSLTLNRPREHNALGPELVVALSDALETLHGADHVRAVLLRGAGGVFSAGPDARWLAESVDWLEDDVREDALRLALMFKKLHELPQLTVALVDGGAVSTGAGLVAACDLAIATSSSSFAFPEVTLGLIPATVGPYVVNAIGARMAKTLFATGRRLSAVEALSWGLIHEVVETSSHFTDLIFGLTRGMQACAPLAVAEAKRLVDEVTDRRIDASLAEHTAHALSRRRVSEEGREGASAFLTGRPPSWAQ